MSARPIKFKKWNKTDWPVPTLQRWPHLNCANSHIWLDIPLCDLHNDPALCLKNPHRTVGLQPRPYWWRCSPHTFTPRSVLDVQFQIPARSAIKWPSLTIFWLTLHSLRWPAIFLSQSVKLNKKESPNLLLLPHGESKYLLREHFAPSSMGAAIFVVTVIIKGNNSNFDFREKIQF